MSGANLKKRELARLARNEARERFNAWADHSGIKDGRKRKYGLQSTDEGEKNGWRDTVSVIDELWRREPEILKMLKAPCASVLDVPGMWEFIREATDQPAPPEALIAKLCGKLAEDLRSATRWAYRDDRTNKAIFDSAVKEFGEPNGYHALEGCLHAIGIMRFALKSIADHAGIPPKRGQPRKHPALEILKKQFRNTEARKACKLLLEIAAPDSEGDKTPARIEKALERLFDVKKNFAHASRRS
jgi:hypothetical protein